MFKKNQRVLYMGFSVWHIATVTRDQRPGTDMVDIQPHGLNMSTDTEWLSFYAPVERLTLVPDTCESVEQAVQHLVRMDNWKA